MILLCSCKSRHSCIVEDMSCRSLTRRWLHWHIGSTLLQILENSGKLRNGGTQERTRIRSNRSTYTFQEICELIDVAGDELVEILTGPHGAHENGHDYARGSADENGRQPLVGKLQELLDPVSRDGHHAVRQDEYQDSIVIPRLDPRDESRECGRCTCKIDIEGHPRDQRG